MAPSFDAPKGKKISRKWSEAEVAALVAAINQAASNNEGLNWAEIARSVPGRTGKQCREKYKNDLRPDISKDPWVSREEYILARAHCDVGNQWAEIAKYLPGRSENSIKNHWNATLRSKAEAKSRTFLWVYGRIVLQQQGVTSLETFEKAVQQYLHIPQAEPLETIRVPEEYFQNRKQTAGTGSPIKVKIGHATRAKPARSTRRRADETSDSEDDFGDYDSTEDESSQDCSHSQPIQRSTRSAVRGNTTSSAAPSAPASSMSMYGAPMGFAASMPMGLSGLYSQMGCSMSDNGGIPMDGDAAVTIHLQGFSMRAGAPKLGFEAAPVFSMQGMPSFMQQAPEPPKPQHWQMPQAPAGITAAADEWADGDYMAFLQEFSMDADLAGQSAATTAPAPPKAGSKSEIDKAADEEAGDLELFHLLGNLGDDVPPPASASKPGFESLADLSMQDPAQALGVYTSDPLVAAFEMDMGTGFGSAGTMAGSLGTSGRHSQQSTSGSYDMMPYAEINPIASPLGINSSPFRAFALESSFGDFGGPVPMPSLDAVAAPQQQRAVSMPPRPPTTSGMLPPRPSGLAQDGYGWKQQASAPAPVTLKRGSSDALPYSGSYTGLDMFAPPTKRASFSGLLGPVAMPPPLPLLDMDEPIL